jgi:hypothetical protein
MHTMTRSRSVTTSVTASVATVALTLLLASGCDDPTIDTETSDASFTGPGDSTIDGGFDLAACEKCVRTPDSPGPGCGTESSACDGNPLCKVMIACAFASGCVGGPSAKFITCAIPCAEEAGIVSNDNPALTVGEPLFECLVNGACAPVCLGK